NGQSRQRASTTSESTRLSIGLPPRWPSFASRWASFWPIMPAPPMMSTFIVYPSQSAEAHAAALGPFQSFDRAPPRPVFAADPAVEPGFVDQPEEPRVIQLALVRLAAIGRIGKLVVAGERRVLTDCRSHVAFHHLPVVNVELQFEIWLADLIDDR